jgi:hypothetical protein
MRTHTDMGRRLSGTRSTGQDARGETRLRDLLGGERIAEMDAFDLVQVSHVIAVCRQCRSLSEAGRVLFSASHGRKSTTNDADRLRKYLKTRRPVKTPIRFCQSGGARGQPRLFASGSEVADLGIAKRRRRMASTKPVSLVGA